MLSVAGLEGVNAQCEYVVTARHLGAVPGLVACVLNLYRIKKLQVLGSISVPHGLAQLVKFSLNGAVKIVFGATCCGFSLRAKGQQSCPFCSKM